MTNNKVYIYALVDPITIDIRYIGKAKNMTARYNTHIKRAKNNITKTHSSNWIRSVLSNNLLPILILIEEVDMLNWKDKEIYWIAYYRKFYDLTNILDGGNGGATYGRLGKSNTLQHKLKCSLARKGVSIKQNDKNGNRQKALIAFREKNKKSILQYDMAGNFIKEWKGIKDYEKHINIKQSNILRAIKLQKSCLNYLWRFKENDNYPLLIEKYTKKRPSFPNSI